MIWYFEFVSQNGDIVIYKYSRENDFLDGRIEYDMTKKEPFVTVPCAEDLDSRIACNWSGTQFLKVVKNEFPNYLKVCCG